MTIGERIRLARKLAKVKQVELAIWMGVHSATVSAWEAGTQNVPAKKLARLAAGLRVSVAWLKGS